MVALFHRLGIAYYPVPKVACTSIKRMLYQLETGLDPSALRDVDGKHLAVHALYRSTPDGGHWNRVAAAYSSFCVVRDPVERFVSGYRNRIRVHRDLEGDANTERNLRRLRLSSAPDFHTFLRHFALYYRASASVHHHFRPQADFLRNIIRRVNRVYWIHQLDLLERDIGKRALQPVSLPHDQSDGGDVEVSVDEKQRARIQGLFRSDYVMLERAGLASPADKDRLGAALHRRLCGIRVSAGREA